MAMPSRREWSLTRVIRSAILPRRLFISISYDIWSKVSKLPVVQRSSSLLQSHNLLNTAAKLSYSGHGHCEGKPGHGSACTTTKVIGMRRPIHYDFKRHRKLRSHHQSSSCIFVSGGLRSYLVKCMLGFTPFLKLKSLGEKEEIDA